MRAVLQEDKGWSPNWATHPGEHLAEQIETRGWSQADFARLAGLTPKLVSTIIAGRNPVTPETAIKLERVLGLKADIWARLQANWDLFAARARERAADAETEAWVRQFPIKELKARGRLPKAADLGALKEGLLGLLGIGAIEAYPQKLASLMVRHRQSRAHPVSEHHVAAWLMLGEEKARAMALPSFDAERFVASVREIRTLTEAEPSVFEPRMRSLCREAGVVLVFEKPISQTRLYGSARWLDREHAIIQMSLRMRSNDHFWWTFFHEAGHLVLHRGRNFVEEKDGSGDPFEQEADQWAEEMLVGRERFDLFASTRPRSEAAVRRFANEAGIHPGIVVGMLQHRRSLPHTHLNKLKARFTWVSESSSSRGAGPE
ncbi:MAG: HigA family addiction module antitoxin [Defluviicoccus sp.]